MTEDQLEQETISWLIYVGYSDVYGPDIAVDGKYQSAAFMCR